MRGERRRTSARGEAKKRSDGDAARESLAGDSRDSRQIPAVGAIGASFCGKKFLTGLTEGLRVSWRHDLRSLARRGRRLTIASTRKSESSKSLVRRGFLQRREKFCAARSVIFSGDGRCAALMLARTQQLVSKRAHRRSIKRRRCFFSLAGVIGMQCSRSPRALYRHRHSLMARRAAWRRREGQRRSQRQRKARRRPSAGRRSRRTLLHSLRLRMMSTTASHGPARVEER
jgi:hypothetical protein